jgi:TPR repeat protein
MLAAEKLIAVILLIAAPAVLAEEHDREKDSCPRGVAAFSGLQKRANGGNPEAQTLLATCYQLGRHVKPDHNQTMHWLTEAANQQYPQAEYELGRIYLYGRGISPDYQQALKWEQKAAEHHQPQAQRDLAYMYERGLGVPPDPALATQWNRKAAEQGQPEAEFHLAQSLEKSEPAEARRWYLKAAKHDQPQAELQLARIHAQSGQAGCPQALLWYRKAAENGEAPAMEALAKLYEGTTCGPNKVQAYTWFYLATRFGIAQPDVDKAASALSSAEKKNADAVAERWIAKHSGAQKEEDEEERKAR